MLIRSQNKERLYNLNTISGLTYQETHDYKRRKENNASHEICIDYGGLIESIGVYSTKEKAIKVLDVVQEEYLYCERCKTRGEEAGNIPSYVFQMPQDSEVQP